MSDSLVTVLYLLCGALFILSLGGLSTQETASRGNRFGVIGMLIAIATTAFGTKVSGSGYAVLAACVAVGAGIGAVLAARVEMTAMPQLVAILHSFVGLAAVLVGFASTFGAGGHLTGVEGTIHAIETIVGVFVGAITFTGSIVAFGKLQGTFSGKPFLMPGRHAVNLAMLIGCVVLGWMFVNATDDAGKLMPLLGVTVISCILGVHLVVAIGGADMP